MERIGPMNRLIDGEVLEQRRPRRQIVPVGDGSWTTLLGDDSTAGPARCIRVLEFLVLAVTPIITRLDAESPQVRTVLKWLRQMGVHLVRQDFLLELGHAYLNRRVRYAAAQER